jgi:hypothetical protein
MEILRTQENKKKLPNIRKPRRVESPRSVSREFLSSFFLDIKCKISNKKIDYVGAKLVDLNLSQIISW